MRAPIHLACAMVLEDSTLQATTLHTRHIRCICRQIIRILRPEANVDRIAQRTDSRQYNQFKKVENGRLFFEIITIQNLKFRLAVKILKNCRTANSLLWDQKIDCHDWNARTGGAGSL